MNPMHAVYSIVQYLPDSGRAEVANVGVVLFVPRSGQIEMRTSPTLDRVRRFFSPSKSELERIALAIESLKNRLHMAGGEFTEEESFARFVAARADAIRL